MVIPLQRARSYLLLTRAPLYSSRRTFTFDLHVLSTPPAFVLSQNQTLTFYSFHKETPTEASIPSEIATTLMTKKGGFSSKNFRFFWFRRTRNYLLLFSFQRTTQQPAYLSLPSASRCAASCEKGYMRLGLTRQLDFVFLYARYAAENNLFFAPLWGNRQRKQGPDNQPPLFRLRNKGKSRGVSSKMTACHGGESGETGPPTVPHSASWREVFVESA